MAEIIFKELTVDSMFDFCELIDVIGTESFEEVLGQEDLKKFKEKSYEEVGVTVIMKMSALFIKSIPKARKEICTFFAGCTEWEDGSPVTAEDIRKMKFSRFIKIIRDFFKQEDLKDFFGEAAAFADTEHGDLKNSATGDTAIHMGI